MPLTPKEKTDLLEALDKLTAAQQQWVKGAIIAFNLPKKFWRASDSDIITALATSPRIE